MICILIGFLLGLAIVPWIHQYGVHQFPTTEMRGRGELRSVLYRTFAKLYSAGRMIAKSR